MDVAELVPAVALGGGGRVGGPEQAVVGDGGQHLQVRRLRRVPAGEQSVHCGQILARADDEVGPALGPAGAAADSRARTTVVPMAMTRFASRTAALVNGGTENHSAYGGSSRSGLDRPQCRTTVATPTPRRRRLRSTRAVTGRPALGISALPGVSAWSVH